MKKKLLILYSGNDFEKTIPFDSKGMLLGNEVFYNRGLEHNVEVIRSSIESYNKNKGVFERYWTYKNNQWQKIFRTVKPNTIWDKSWTNVNSESNHFKTLKKISNNYHFLNDPYFIQFFRNKFFQYVYLNEFMPKTYYIQNKGMLFKKLKKLDWQKIVIKPLFGSSGKDIYIGSNDLSSVKNFYENISEPLIIQKFIQSQQISETIRDYRLIFVKNKLVYYLCRIASKGSLFTNVAKGATKEYPDNIDNELILQLSQKIIKKMTIWGENIFSLDFMIDKNKKPMLIELNTTPGFWLEDKSSKHYQSYFDAVFELVS